MALPELATIHRPRWRDTVPLLWRGSTIVQFGDDVIVDRVTPAHVAWLRSLDGLRTAQEISDELPVSRADACRILRALLAAGGLDDAAQLPDAARWAPPEQRADVSRRLGAAMATYRDPHLALRAMDNRGRTHVAILGDGLLRDAVAAAVDAAGLLEVAQLGKADVVVLADSHHPDVPAHFAHESLDLPHVHLGVLGARAVVGPFVLPGRTSCLRCAHLHRRDADSAWPLLAVQWSQAVPAMSDVPIDPLLCRLACDLAVTIVRAWADDPERPAHGMNAAFELRLPDGLPQRVERPAHPLCGCLWQASAAEEAIS